MNKKRALILLAGIIVLGIALRVPRFFSIIPAAGVVDSKIIWYDEAVSIYFAEQNIADTVTLSGLDTSPCLFFILLHFWLLIVGTGSAVLMALLPFFFSVASIVAIFILGKDIRDENTGLLSALFMAMSPLNIQYATEIRAYSLLVFIAVFFLLFLWRSIQKGETRHYLGLIVSTLLLLYTHYSAIALIIPGYLALLYYKRAEIKDIIACVAAVAIGYIPALYVFQRWGDFFSAGSGSFYGRFYSHGGIVAFFQYLYSIVFGAIGNNAAPVLLSFFILAFLYYFWRRSGRDKRDFLVVLVIAGFVVLSVGKMIYHERYFIVLTVPVILILALAARNIKVKSLVLPLLVSTLFFILFIFPAYATVYNRAFKYYAPSFARVIQNNWQEGDMVIADHYNQVLMPRYLPVADKIKLFFPFNGELIDDPAVRWRYSDFPIINDGNVFLVDELTTGSARFWVVGHNGDSVEDPHGALSKYLGRKYTLIATYYFPTGLSLNDLVTELRLYRTSR